MDRKEYQKEWIRKKRDKGKKLTLEVAKEIEASTPTVDNVDKSVDNDVRQGGQLVRQPDVHKPSHDEGMAFWNKAAQECLDRNARAGELLRKVQKLDARSEI